MFARGVAGPRDGRKMAMKEIVPGVLLAGPLAAPPEDLNPQDLSWNYRNRITRRQRIPQRSYRSQLENGPIRWARTSESSLLYTSVDASRPHDARRNTGGNGGAAGNRTRVRSAYYKRVYRHIRSKPRLDQYRASVARFKGATRVSRQPPPVRPVALPLPSQTGQVSPDVRVPRPSHSGHRLASGVRADAGSAGSSGKRPRS